MDPVHIFLSCNNGSNWSGRFSRGKSGKVLYVWQGKVDDQCLPYLTTPFQLSRLISVEWKDDLWILNWIGVAFFKALSRNLSAWAERNHETIQSEQGFEPRPPE
jgi:hypothetical protein